MVKRMNEKDLKNLERKISLNNKISPTKIKISLSSGSNENNIKVLHTKKDINEKDNQNISNKVKISLSSGNNESNINTTKKNTGINVYDIIKTNQNSLYEVSHSPNHFSIAFTGAKLLSLNQILAILQYRKYEMFSYKKSWHNIIHKILTEEQLKSQRTQQSLPYFDTLVEITIFRQAPRLVDEDALSIMFKYIIDALKRTPISNPYGILAEDNPKIVHRIEPYSEKGEHCIGIKVKLVNGTKKQMYSLDKILLP